MARAKKALASLPWVDQKSIDANVETQQVKFRVPDMKQFNRTDLLEAFKKVNFLEVKVLSPAS